MANAQLIEEKEKNKMLDNKIFIKGEYEGTIRDIIKLITPTPINPVPIEMQMKNEYSLVDNKDFISKDKIREKISILEMEEYYDYLDYKRSIKILRELLEE